MGNITLTGCKGGVWVKVAILIKDRGLFRTGNQARLEMQALTYSVAKLYQTPFSRGGGGVTRLHLSPAIINKGGKMIGIDDTDARLKFIAKANTLKRKGFTNSEVAERLLGSERYARGVAKLTRPGYKVALLNNK